MRCGRLTLLTAIVLINGQLLAAREWSDAKGKFKIEGEFVAVRSGNVILEKPDGSIITVALSKLSTADQKFVASQEKEPPAAPANAPKQPAAAPGNPDAIAKKALAVLRDNCYRCHGEDGSSEGGFNFAQNLPKIAHSLVTVAHAADSVLLKRITAADDSVMPPAGEMPRPSATDIAAVRTWIEAGAPALTDERKRDFVSSEQIAKWIAADIQKAPERSRRFLRYFTLTHLYNAGVADDELQTYRNAFAKLVNSLSWNTSLLTPETLDPARTVFRIDMRLLNWNLKMWGEVEQANPYFLEMKSPEAVAACDTMQCRMPFVRADWFVSAASKPPLYHVMLGIPETDGELENLLRVNVAANIDQEQTIRAAFNRSGVSQNNRLIEWHKSPYGSYWKSYDFAGNAGRQNLFEYPLGPGTGETQFQHDGGELIFTLPNGLQGYMLVTGDGKRIDRGPTNIVSDPKSSDRTVVNGVSCMSCHYTGVIAKADEVGPAVRANRKAFANADEILALYRESDEIASVLKDDSQRFAAAMKKLEIHSLSRSGEPISAMAHRFEQELDLPMVACEFGLSTDDFLKRLDQSDTMSRRFAALRSPGGVIKRDVFATGFAEAASELKLISDDSARVARSSPSIPRSPTARASKSTPGKLPRADAARTSKGPLRDAIAGEVCRFSDLGWGVKSLAFSPNGAFLAVGKPDRAVRIYDLTKQTQIAGYDKLEILQAVETCAYTPSGSRFLACGGSGHISICDAAKNGFLKDSGQFAGHSNSVNCIAISGDGRFALSGGGEKKARYWEIETGKELGVFADFEGPVKACFISRNATVGMATDGATLLELSLTGKSATVKKKRKLGRSWASGQAAAISSDGKYIATGDSYDVLLWNLESEQPLGKMSAGDIQWSMIFAPDCTRLLSGGSGKVNVWDVRKMTRIHSQAVPESGYIHCLAASADSKLFATAGREQLFVFTMPSVH